MDLLKVLNQTWPCIFRLILKFLNKARSFYQIILFQEGTVSVWHTYQPIMAEHNFSIPVPGYSKQQAAQ